MITCRYCGLAIQMHKTAKGKRMPLDIGANPEGNVAIIDNVAVVLAKDDPRRATALLLMPHWATCTKLPRRGRKEK